MATSTAPATAQQVSTTIALPAPAPSKNAVDRSSVALAPCGINCPKSPQPLGSISGALLSPDSGLPSSRDNSAPMISPTRPNSELRPSTAWP